MKSIKPKMPFIVTKPISELAKSNRASDVILLGFSKKTYLINKPK